MGRLRIIVLGYIVRGPLGGMVWSNTQFIRGLRALGHDVYFVEDSDDFAGCYDPRTNTTSTDPTYGLAFATALFQDLDFAHRWCYYDAHTHQWLGPARSTIQRTCESADVVVNLCGVNPLRSWFDNVPVRVLVDEDPGFTQVRNLSDTAFRARSSDHTAFFTFGENIPSGNSRVPDDGFPWIPTRQPLVLDSLNETPGRPNSRFTTVMQWNSYPPVQYNGHRLGMKAESLHELMALPKLTPAHLELAIGGGAPVDTLRSCGWLTTDPLEITETVHSYLKYIAGSKAEIGIAKHGYVSTYCGWFSERSVAYMALGRPVVAQETGFTTWLETGAGVLAFDNIECAAAAIADVQSRYSFHCRSARELAEAYFSAPAILTNLLAQATQQQRYVPSQAVDDDHDP